MTWGGTPTACGNSTCGGLAVDPADPDIILISAAPGPLHCLPMGQRSAVAGGPHGAPPRKGTHVLTLLTHDADLGVVYAVAHKGALYRSADAGSRWKPVVPVTESWPRRRVRGAVAAA